MTVWALNGEFTALFMQERGYEPSFEVVMPDYRDNARLLAQDGLFTLSLSEEPLEKEILVVMQEQCHPGLLQRFDIDVMWARGALLDLAMMGIHHGSLFPGLEGTCMRLKQEFFVGPGELGPAWREMVRQVAEETDSGHFEDTRPTTEQPRAE